MLRAQVGLSGTRSNPPPTDPAAFAQFARRLAHPLVAERLAALRPVESVKRRMTIQNERRHFEQVRALRP